MATAVLAALNETDKELRLFWSSKFNVLTEFAMLALVFVGISFLLGNGELAGETLAAPLLGFLVWHFTSLATMGIGETLREEAQTGTLEQMYIGPASSAVLLLGGLIGRMLWGTLEIALVAAVLVPLLGIPIQFQFEAVPVFVLTVVGLYGFGFLVGAATLVFKLTSSLPNLFINALIFLNGALIPIDRFPLWLEVLARTLPSTQGIVVLRRVIIDQASLLDVWADGSLALLLVKSAAYFTVGLLLFRWAERVAKRRGSLGHY